MENPRQSGRNGSPGSRRQFASGLPGSLFLVVIATALACTGEVPRPAARDALDASAVDVVDPDAVADAGAADVADAGAVDAADAGAVDAADAGAVDVVDAGGVDVDAGAADAVDAGADAGAVDGADAGCALGPSFSCTTCGHPGDHVDVTGLDVLAAPLVGTSAIEGERVLLFSDSPESPTSSGVLFEGHATGAARIYAYHANGTPVAKKLSVVVDNDADAPLVMNIERFAVGRPSTRYPEVGQLVTASFLTADNGVTKSVAAHSRGLLLVQSLDGVVVGPDELIHAIVDVTFSGPARVRVVMLDAGTDTLARVDDVAVLPRDVHVRGTFPGADRSVDVGCAEGVARVRLGGPGAPAGVDELTHAPVVDGGHYGIRYVLRVDATAALLVDPRAGLYQGAVVAGGALVLPVSSSSTDAVYVGDAPSLVSWMAPGGSSLPVDLLIAP